MIFDCGREISILVDFYRHSLLMRKQETDLEGHQKLMALMAFFTLELDYPSQELACVVGGFGGGFLVLRTPMM